MIINRIIVSALLAVSLTGCISSKSYLDQKYKKDGVSYSSIKKANAPYEAKIDIEFQRNGVKFPRADKELRTDVEKIFKSSGVVTPVANDTGTSIKVICNNIADLAEARKKGFGTGLTFGAAGSEVTDFYNITIEFKHGDKIIQKKYDHAIHTIIGHKASPYDGVQPVSLVNAFNGVIEDVILQFIKEMQANNELTLNYVVPVKQV